LLFELTGAEVASSDDYRREPNLMFYIQTYRNAIGDLDVFSYDVWDNASYTYHNLSIFMIQLIWFLWVIQQFFMFVLLMNFLIAIINQMYEVNIAES
jgi:hypothetical protein